MAEFRVFHPFISAYVLGFALVALFSCGLKCRLPSGQLFEPYQRAILGILMGLWHQARYTQLGKLNKYSFDMLNSRLNYPKGRFVNAKTVLSVFVQIFFS